MSQAFVVQDVPVASMTFAGWRGDTDVAIGTFPLLEVLTGPLT